MGEKPREESGDDVEKVVISIKCAWCHKDMGTKTDNKGQEGQISHGICPECTKKFFGESDPSEKKE